MTPDEYNEHLRDEIHRLEREKLAIQAEYAIDNPPDSPSNSQTDAHDLAAQAIRALENSVVTAARRVIFEMEHAENPNVRLRAATFVLRNTVFATHGEQANASSRLTEYVLKHNNS